MAYIQCFFALNTIGFRYVKGQRFDSFFEIKDLEKLSLNDGCIFVGKHGYMCPGICVGLADDLDFL